MRKLIISLLVPVIVIGGLLGPVSAKKKKRAPVTFKADGSILVPNPLDLMDVGITRTEFESACEVPFATQGLDGFVIEVPRAVSAVNTRVSVTATSASGVGLIDLFFFDENCTDVGMILGSDDFDPLMYAGTKFVLVTNWLGDPTDFTFSATEVR